MNTLYVHFRPNHLQFKLMDQDGHLIALLGESAGERSLLSATFLLDRHYSISQLVWEYHESDSIATHCYAMVMLERIFGVARHDIEEAPNAHPE